MKLWEEAPQTQFLGITVYTFGIFCLIGALCATACICLLCRELKTKRGTAWILACTSVFFGLVFSKLAYALVRLAKDLTGGEDHFPLLSWFRLDIGGWSLYGMIFGVLFAAWITSKITSEKTERLLDIVSCSLPLMIAAERLGEKIFEVFNISRSIQDGQFPANTFLAVEDTEYGDYYLATYIYCAIAALILFLILVFMLVRTNRTDGELWILFMILCGAGGIILSSLRSDSFMEISFVKLQQVAAAVLLVWGVIAAGRRSGTKQKRLFCAAAISLPIAICICIAIEFALDKTTISHVLLYAVMFAVLAVPAVMGILMLKSHEKGTSNA